MPIELGSELAWQIAEADKLLEDKRLPCPACYLRGDCDHCLYCGDGKVNAWDVVDFLTGAHSENASGVQEYLNTLEPGVQTAIEFALRQRGVTLD